MKTAAIKWCNVISSSSTMPPLDIRRTGQLLTRLTGTNIESFPLAERDFVDRRLICFRSGKGGDPAPNTVRGQKKNGPAFGGHGGSVYLRASSSEESLSNLPVDDVISAEAGGDGHEYSRGLHGSDKFIDVPVGTIIRERVRTGMHTSDGRRIHKPKFIYQFLNDGDTLKICQGGKGGVAPLTFKKGDGRKGSNGEKKSVDLELRLVSDCALIGAPNSGKTSILSSMTSSLTRIGPEPYSTTRPHLGTLHFRDGIEMKIVDLPGVVEGDATDKFRGIRILRHMWRAKLIMYCIDVSNNETDAFEHFQKLREEVHAFDQGKFPRKEIIVATKCDMLHKDTLMTLDSLYFRVQSRLGPHIPIVGTSARFGLGISRLVDQMRRTLYPSEVDVKKAPVPAEILRDTSFIDSNSV